MKSREELLNAGRKRKVMDLPDWGEVTFQRLGIDDVLELEKATEGIDRAVRSIVLGIVNPETGEKIFTLEDEARIRTEAHPKVIIEAWNAYKELNGVTTEAIEEASKNSQSSQSDRSS